jgi:hypothetical protein
MNYLLEYLPDAYLQKIAHYFAGLRPPPLPQPVVDAIAAVLARGVAHLFAGVVVPGARREGVELYQQIGKGCPASHGAGLVGEVAVTGPAGCDPPHRAPPDTTLGGTSAAGIWLEGRGR